MKRRDRGARVRRLQQNLLTLGFDPGTPDGIFGPNTERAVKAFQRSEFVTGVADPLTLRRIRERLGQRPAPEAPGISLPGAEWNPLVSAQHRIEIPSSNYSPRPQRVKAPTHIILHLTGGNTRDGATDRFSRPESKVSAHFLIPDRFNRGPGRDTIPVRAGEIHRVSRRGQQSGQSHLSPPQRRLAILPRKIGQRASRLYPESGRCEVVGVRVLRPQMGRGHQAQAVACVSQQLLHRHRAGRGEGVH